MVFVFATKPDDSLASLAKEIDKIVEANEEKKLAAVINFIGEPSPELQETIKAFGEKYKIKNVALAITKDASAFKISDKAAVTVMHYKGKEVKFNHAVAAGKLDKKTVKKIVDGTETILN